MRIRKAVLPVAGLGTRFLPITKAVPKELLPVLEKPLVQYAVEEAHAAGITDILFVNGRGKNALEDYFDHAFEVEHTLKSRGKGDLADAITQMIPPAGRYAFVRQTQPLGLGHAILAARPWVENEPFAVLLPDDLILSDTPCLQEMCGVYDLSLGNLAAIEEVPQEQTERYGVLKPESESNGLIKACGVVEKPAPHEAPSTSAILGRYILHPAVFDTLSTQKPGVGGEIQLTDALATMIATHGLHGFRINGMRFDCGAVEGMVAANVAFGLKDKQIKDKLRDLLSKLMTV